jgi:hypothetical protein
VRFPASRYLTHQIASGGLVAAGFGYVVEQGGEERDRFGCGSGESAIGDQALACHAQYQSVSLDPVVKAERDQGSVG